MTIEVSTEVTAISFHGGGRVVSIVKNDTRWLMSDGNDLISIYDDSLLDLAKQHAADYLNALADIDARRATLDADYATMLDHYRDGQQPRHFTADTTP